MKHSILHAAALLAFSASMVLGCAVETEPSAPDDDPGGSVTQDEKKGGKPTPPATPYPYQSPEHYSVEWVSDAYCAANPVWIPDSLDLDPAHYPNDLDNHCQPGLYVIDATVPRGRRAYVNSAELDPTTRTMRIAVHYTSYKTEAAGGAAPFTVFVPAGAELEVCGEPYTFEVREQATAWVEYLPELETMTPCE